MTEEEKPTPDRDGNMDLDMKLVRDFRNIVSRLGWCIIHGQVADDGLSASWLAVGMEIVVGNYLVVTMRVQDSDEEKNSVWLIDEIEYDNDVETIFRAQTTFVGYVNPPEKKTADILKFPGGLQRGGLGGENPKGGFGTNRKRKGKRKRRGRGR